MTGVQTCALPICFPVTIGEGSVGIVSTVETVAPRTERILEAGNSILIEEISYVRGIGHRTQVGTKITPEVIGSRGTGSPSENVTSTLKTKNLITQGRNDPTRTDHGFRPLAILRTANRRRRLDFLI